MSARGFPNLLRVIKVAVSDNDTLLLFVFPVSIGIILSGNLVSQVLLALILSYAGGQRNRPKWIAGSVLLGSVSSFLLAIPYFVFGASEESLQLTQEYMKNHNIVSPLSLCSNIIPHSYHFRIRRPSMRWPTATVEIYAQAPPSLMLKAVELPKFSHTHH